MEIIMAFAAWYGIGLLCIPFHIYIVTQPSGWITLDWTVGDLLFCMLMAVLGPISLLASIVLAVCFFIARFFNTDRVLIRSRFK